MSNIGLNTGLKALLTAQAALDTTGHNISNANTPGYSRQRLEVSSAGALYHRDLMIGTGVNADVVTRTADALLLTRTTAQIASLNRLDAALGGMTEVEALMGEPGGFGLGSGLSDFFGALSELSVSTDDLVLRTGVVQSAIGLTTQFNHMASSLSSMSADSAGQVSLQVKQVNALSEEIVALNIEISKAEAGGIPANDLRDDREQKMRELAQYVDIEHREDDKGVVRISTAGRMIVGGTHAYAMSAKVQIDGSVELFVEGSSAPVKPKGGMIGGLIGVGQDFIQQRMQDFDALAKNLIFEMNRVHSTGTPGAGTFQTLTSAYAVEDSDYDGLATDELLSNSGLPFDVTSGEMFVNVSRLDTGEIESHRISIDQTSTTVGEFVAELDSISGINATLNSYGKLQVFADGGFGFDFAARLDPSPDKLGTFGSGHASLGAGSAGPYALVDGDTIDLVGAVGPFSVTLNSADFAAMSEATAQEIADVLNADANMQANGLRATVTDDRLYIQTDATGSAAGFTVSGGTALGALSLSAGTSTTGSDNSVDIQIGGTYTGEANDKFVFVPNGDGVVGTTPGLEIDVFSQTGQLVATLDVGDGYQPGTELEVAEGVTAKFSFGELSATDNDMAELEVRADSDTSDVLAAFGLNALFTGTGAGDIAIREDLELDPSLIAAGSTGAVGDNSTILALLDLQSEAIDGLNGESFGGFYGDVISDVGFEISTASATRDVQQFLLDNLENRREQISGVNIDEELVNMVRFEQSFAAASRYIQALNELSGEILNLI